MVIPKFSPSALWIRPMAGPRILIASTLQCRCQSSQCPRPWLSNLSIYPSAPSIILSCIDNFQAQDNQSRSRFVHDTLVLPIACVSRLGLIHSSYWPGKYCPTFLNVEFATKASFIECQYGQIHQVESVDDLPRDSK